LGVDEQGNEYRFQSPEGDSLHCHPFHFASKRAKMPNFLPFSALKCRQDGLKWPKRASFCVSEHVPMPRKPGGCSEFRHPHTPTGAGWVPFIPHR
jgi:hypothetical protein